MRSTLRVWISMGFAFATAAAAPSVQGVQGTLDHQATLTVTGSAFGTKTQAAPVVWDDASGTDLTQKWDYAYPSTNDEAFRIKYRSPAEVTLQAGPGGMPLPHPHVQKYIAGAHYSSTPVNATSGYDVSAGKSHQEGQLYTYISYYRAADPHWHLNTGCTTSNASDCDHNFKEYDYSAGDDQYGQPEIYICDASGQSPLAPAIEWGANYAEIKLTIFSVNTTLMNWYPTVGTVFSKVQVPGPASGGWHKVELLMKHGSADGFHRIYQDNKLVWDVSLNDDQDVPGSRNELVIGGYAREYGTTDEYQNNWRYYADVYYDHSLARVVLADTADYAQAQIVEAQIPSAWSDASITLSANLGKLNAGQLAYLFVFDADDNHNAVGFPVTIGGASTGADAGAGGGAQTGTGGGSPANGGGAQSGTGGGGAQAATGGGAPSGSGGGTGASADAGTAPGDMHGGCSSAGATLPIALLALLFGRRRRALRPGVIR
jgi:hypothetical protein